MRWSWIVMLVAGCYRPSAELCEGSDCVVEDATPPDLSTQGVCAGEPNGLLPNTCFDPVPRDDFALPSTINTDDLILCNTPLGPPVDVCFIAANRLSVAGTVRASGSRPLVLWSATTIELSAGAVLDVASHAGGGGSVLLGPDADNVKCPAVDGKEADVPMTQRKLGTGGCGGSFGAPGGFGGSAANGAIITLFADCAPIAVTLDAVRGGCKGGDGGLSDDVGSLNGGSSGGAVYLMARGTIRVAGAIDARGTHGRTASANSNRMAGGGGGGSGGLVAFDTPELVNLDGAVIVALGGGGSSGAGLVSDPNMFSGLPGQDPTLSPPAPATASGARVPNNAGGGDSEPGGGVVDTEVGGGGGGGGGVGILRTFSPKPVSQVAAKLLPPLIN